jgi:hypothetical protein
VISVSCWGREVLLPSSRSFDPPRERGGFLPLRGFTIGAWVFFSLSLIRVGSLFLPDSSPVEVLSPYPFG